MENLNEEPRGGVLEFTKLTEPETEALRQEIAKNNGVIRIFIHPFSRSSDPETGHDLKKDDRVIKILRKVFKSKLSPPTFILEEHHLMSIWDNPKILEKLAVNIYTIPTISNHGFPILDTSRFTKGYDTPTELSKDYMQKVARQFITMLMTFKFLGVKKIILGGRNLEWDNENNHPQRCVGAFLGLCKLYASHAGIEIKLSAGTAPENFTSLRGKILEYDSDLLPEAINTDQANHFELE